MSAPQDSRIDGQVPHPFDFAHPILPGDRRAERRRAYPFRQRYAPVVGGALPVEEQFRWAELADVSAHGVAIVDTEPPTAEQLVVELGDASNVICYLARVRAINRMAADHGPRYRIACELLHEVGRPAR